MSSLYSNFKDYDQCGKVPTKRVPCFGYYHNSRYDYVGEIPQNSFYKSVHCIDSIVRPVKDVACSMASNVTFTLASVVLQPLYLALAYLSYWPAKGLAKAVDNLDPNGKTESLINYSFMLSCKARNHGGAVAGFVRTILSYAVSAVICCYTTYLGC